MHNRARPLLLTLHRSVDGVPRAVANGPQPAVTAGPAVAALGEARRHMGRDGLALSGGVAMVRARSVGDDGE